MRIAPQGTGHGSEPLEPLEDAMLLRTVRMRGVRIDPAARTARADAGAVWAGRDHPRRGARTLLDLDFAGDLIDVVSQPMRLRFEAGGTSPTGIDGYLSWKSVSVVIALLLASSQGWPSPSTNVGSACQTI
jgi:hypothetical protein